MFGYNYMIPKKFKHLAEVDFPIAAVSKHLAKEKAMAIRPPSSVIRLLSSVFWGVAPCAMPYALPVDKIFKAVLYPNVV